MRILHWVCILGYCLISFHAVGQTSQKKGIYLWGIDDFSNMNNVRPHHKMERITKSSLATLKDCQYNQANISDGSKFQQRQRPANRIGMLTGDEKTALKKMGVELILFGRMVYQKDTIDHYFILDFHSLTTEKSFLVDTLPIFHDEYPKDIKTKIVEFLKKKICGVSPQIDTIKTNPVSNKKLLQVKVSDQAKFIKDITAQKKELDKINVKIYAKGDVWIDEMNLKEFIDMLKLGAEYQQNFKVEYINKSQIKLILTN